jgi:hypothetical protein
MMVGCPLAFGCRADRAPHAVAGRRPVTAFAAACHAALASDDSPHRASGISHGEFRHVAGCWLTRADVPGSAQDRDEQRVQALAAGGGGSKATFAKREQAVADQAVERGGVEQVVARLPGDGLQPRELHALAEA